jgi:hypothetical protein
VELAHESGMLRGSIQPQAFSVFTTMAQVTLKVIPALLAGCTCVLKPSELAPLSSMLFAQLVHDAGCALCFFQNRVPAISSNTPHRFLCSKASALR